MLRRTVIAAATTALAALLVIGQAPAAARPSRVIVVLAPYLTWEDVASGPMPATRSLVERGVAGNVNVRSSTPGAGAPSISRGALMLSAGASGLSDPKADEGYDATETVGSQAARDLYRLLYARSAGTSQVLYLGSARQVLANAGTTSDTRIGALGQVMHDGGILTAAIGNSDKGLDAEIVDHARPAAIIAADEAGLVDIGDVSTAMLAADPSAPYGARTDQPAVEKAYRAALDAGARFIVIDPGDLARAYALSSSTTTEAAAVARSGALRTTDNIVGMVDRTLSESDLLIVFAPVVPEVQDQPPAFAPVVMSGPVGETGEAKAGLVSTPSTRRAGICTITDVTATLVSALGQQQLPEMVGRPVGAAGAGSAEARMAVLSRMNAGALAVETTRLSVINTYIVFAIIVLLVAAALVGERGRSLPPAPRSIVRALLLLCMAFAPAGLLMFLVPGWSSSPVAALAALIGTALVIWLLALLAARGRPAGFSVMVLAGLTSLVLLGDQIAGAPLSVTGFFSYSPLVGARFYGIGNEMAGALLGASMICVALALDLYRDRPWAAGLRRFGWPAAGVVVVLVTAAPFLGANIGAIAWMTVGYLVGGMVLAGRKVFTWRNAAVAAVAVILLLAAASASDMIGSGGGSHLGRALSATGESGIGPFLTILARKAETNMRLFGRTNWTWLLVAVLGILGYMRWRPRGEFAAALHRYPAVAAAMSAALLAGLVGYFTEDSGIIIPALAMLPVGVAILDLMLARLDEGGDG